jgi:hypothetical protein
MQPIVNEQGVKLNAEGQLATCGQCRYFWKAPKPKLENGAVNLEPAAQNGQCRRFPPQLLILPQGPAPFFVHLHAGHPACFEFKGS